MDRKFFHSLPGKLVFVLLLNLVSLGFSPMKAQCDEQPAQILIGFTPGDDPEKLKVGALELAKKIQSRIGVPTNIYISQNYQGLIDAMKSGKLDFAFFTAMSFVFAEKQAGAKVLMQKVWELPYYYSAIITRKDSGIAKIQDLKGKVFGYVDEKSTSGFLYPRVFFQSKKIDPATFFKKTLFTGNHQASIKMLIDKKVDAVAVFSNDPKALQSAWSVFFPKSEKDMRLLWISEPIPNDPFCVRNEFYDKFPRFTHDLMSTFIDMKDDPIEGNIFKKLLGYTELKMVTSRHYEPVRQMVKQLDLKLEQ